ncbi:glycoside hydrolase TIM-barrel-like domain-containing protein [Ruegeria sp. 1NDH52C]|uniref:Glycoside hydrolase TIM-barrel-like domain-containing protein n=1 Tax=Ruegeria alba TaxID=2916756 RepID=A0ABS9NSR8_9RHOB|nr:glycoside hydrolase TIM-barrel-like domain-containing protein [Ruegeria alba]MCG6557264.1 glycoside hydrolase TIM-barrel-like domain-containing protein [Ruegeria alba]
MATILLSAAGAAIGGSVGGTVAGLSSAVLGRAVGATVGRVLDQRLLGSGAEAVETGKVDRFRLTNSGEGHAIAQVYGRMRVGGQVIWASDFAETTTTSGGGKGSRPQPRTTQYSYSVSLAVALCEGEIAGVRRVWADGDEIAPDELNMRVYRGTADQLPDPVMEAVEGAGLVPAYRGTAYVVFEDLDLDRFGNRVPQFSFEVVRGDQPDADPAELGLAGLVKGVALIPGTGEYALATTQVNYSNGPGSFWAANSNSPSGQTDFLTSLEALGEELPEVGAASLVVSWFGGDLRCGNCEIRPKVERKNIDGSNMPWRVSGLSRTTVDEIARIEDRPIYGGTPADAAVVEAIRHMHEAGQRVMFYPFILMDQLAGNTLINPWTGEEGQPHLPWRGRITLSLAPTQPGTPDGTAAADAEVAAFFGTASAADFVIGDGVVTYSGPEDWGLRRFILHYAALCKAAGGVSSFCIGSEMRGLTQIRGAAGFPAVQALRALAAEVRTILGPETKLGYAADWSEYFGYQPQDGSGDRYFHLDPLWADPEIDFVGIDNYMPLSDWRDGEDHADAQAGTRHIYEQDYLRGNVEGGEGYDWYYHSPEAEAAQIRTPITDDAHGEAWVWRYKDIRSWWANPHHERIGGNRQALPTDWVPQSKPIWFTELGCAAVDKGTNQPNKFLDPKSSESSLPKYSNGARDDLMQLAYLNAVLGYWNEPGNNPVSVEYQAPMIDMANAYVWAWDVRPYPAFPNNRELWADGANYARGHWLNGRSGNRTLASVVREICARAKVSAVDLGALWGIVRGYTVDQVSDARSALQPLMLRYGFDAIERDGKLVFRLRDGGRPVELGRELLAVHEEIDGALEHRRESDLELSGRVRLRFVQADANHDVVAEEAVLPDDATHAVSSNEMPLALTRAEGRQTVERWLAEARLGRDTIRFALPPSRLALGAGDVVRLPDAGDEIGGLYRVDRVEQAHMQLIEAVRVEPNVYLTSDMAEDRPVVQEFVPPVPVLPLLMDLPLITGDEVPHAPHVAVTAQPWPGTVAVYSSASDEAYRLDEIVATRAVIGVTETPLARARPGLWDRGDAVQVKLVAGELESRPLEAILNGENLAAIGDGSTDNWELFQFREAELIAPDTYLLRNRLRGQLGSDALMPDVWPAGSQFVLIDPRLVQLDLASSERRIARHYRIGPSRRSYDDPSYVHRVDAFDGIGLRPYAPAHLRAVENGADIQLSWVRRTRIDGDDWSLPEVPLGEESESYLVRVIKDGGVLREETVSSAAWTYGAAAQVADAVARPFDLSVAQISARFGPGLFRSVTVEA